MKTAKRNGKTEATKQSELPSVGKHAAKTKRPQPTGNPYREGTVSAELFARLNAQPADPREVCRRVAKKFRKSEEKVWQTFEVLRTPKHGSNNKRSKAVEDKKAGTVHLVAL